VLRKTPVAAVELNIGKRLTDLRKGLNLSRKKLEKTSGVPIGVITRVELGRTPIRYRDARRILAAFDKEFSSEMIPLNPLWIAEGVGPVRLKWPFILPENDSISLHERAAFSEFVQANRELLLRLDTVERNVRLPESWLRAYFAYCEQLDYEATIFRDASRQIASIVKRSAEALKKESPFARNLLADYIRNNPVFHSEKRGLTDVSAGVKHEPVKSQMESLLARLNRATEARGKKSELARFMKLPLASISQWLSGGREPGGENTLRLLSWVEQQER
jgi:transcriptional regulator with XRE-family HTH domain